MTDRQIEMFVFGDRERCPCCKGDGRDHYTLVQGPNRTLRYKDAPCWMCNGSGLDRFNLARRPGRVHDA